MSDGADEKFAAVESEIEKECSAEKTSLYEETAEAKERAATRLK